MLLFTSLMEEVQIQHVFFFFNIQPLGQREREGSRQTQRRTDRHRDTDTDTDRHRDRQTETDRDRHRDRKSQKERRTKVSRI